MPLDTSIPMQGRMADPVNAFYKGYTSAQTARSNNLTNQINQQAIDKNSVDAKRETQKFQALDMATDALRIAPLIERGDIQGANEALERRIRKIVARGGNPSHTVGFRDDLMSGRKTPQQALQVLNDEIRAAQETGILQGTGNLTEYQRQSLELERQKMVPTGAGPRGKSVDAWAYNTLLNGNPDSKEFAAAKAHLNRSNTQFVQTEGGLMPITQTPVDTSWATGASASPFGGQPSGLPPDPPMATTTGNKPSSGTSAVGAVIPGTSRPANIDQANAAGFYDRMAKAEEIVSGLEAGGYDASNLRDSMTAGGAVSGFLTSDKGQLYRQAQENWVRANLRKESGAAIPPDEMEREIKNYFPQPNNRADVIKQKAEFRKIATESMKRSAGPGLGAGGAQQPAGSAQQEFTVDPQSGKKYINIGGTIYEAKD